MNEENKNTEASTRPDTPTLDNNNEGTDQELKQPSVENTPQAPVEEPKSEVEATIADRLGKGEETKAENTGNEPTAKTPNLIDLNNLTPSMIQDLQEVMASTPRRKKTKETYNTVELREIDGKVVIGWKDTKTIQKRDDVAQKDVLKLVIPVLFNGEDEYVDILWREEFMQADKVTCRILDTKTKEVSEPVGVTTKRDEDGALTTQEVEMYDTKVLVTLTVAMPDGKEITINGDFVN